MENIICEEQLLFELIKKGTTRDDISIIEKDNDEYEIQCGDFGAASIKREKSEVWNGVEWIREDNYSYIYTCWSEIWGNEIYPSLSAIEIINLLKLS